MNELEQLTKAACEHFGSEELGQAFVDGFIKEAAKLDAAAVMEAINKLNVSRPMGEFTGGALKALGGMAAGGAIYGIAKLVSQSDKAKLHTQFQSSLNSVKMSNRIVKAAPVEKVNSYANTIFNYAPHVATDPNLLGSLLANVIQGESVDPMTIKMLVELESRYKENASTQPFAFAR